MGMPGVIHIKITTVFNEKENSASRKLQYLGGNGLNSLSACSLGTGEFWDIDRSIVADTIKLADGIYKLNRQYVGPGHFDYKWAPTDSDDGMG